MKQTMHSDKMTAKEALLHGAVPPRNWTMRAALAALVVSVIPSSAFAGDASPEGQKLFEAGQHAYQFGDFKTAIEAFEQAFQLERRPGLLFSIGQAHRRQYTIDRRPGHVTVAIKHYREYLTAAPTGGRRAEAADALQQLEILAKSLEVDGQLPALEPEEPGTRLVISSPAEHAFVTVDGGDRRPLPIALETTAGKHTIVVSADGFGEQKREIEVPEHAVTALDVALEETAASLSVAGPSGARVTIDGRDEATLPLANALSLPSGEHRVHVSLGGHESYDETIDVPRAAALKIDAAMPTTTQRKAATGLLISGATLFGAGLVTGGIAVASYVNASSLKSDIDAGKVVCRAGPCDPLDEYNSSVTSTQQFGATAGVFLGLGVLAAGTGLVLFATDSPAPAKASPKAAPAPAAPASSGDLEVSVGPSGLRVRGTF
ncbi:MAG: PEGA domain-containing protein [Polyangiaceae bacterium]